MSMPTTHAPPLSAALLTHLHERILEATEAHDGQRVQEGIDALDQALSEAPASGVLFGQGVQRLRRWCRTLGRVPSSYFLADAVVLDSNRAHCSSALSDVYVGRLRGTKVAVKALRFHVDDQESVQKSFRKEVVTWKCLRHPNIVPFLGISNIFPFCVVSEWMSGGTISAFLAKYPEQNRSRYIQQIIYGLGFMHALGVIHGDLKPANVLVGENANVRLADFGMATVLFNSPTLATTVSGDGVRGTMRYMAPELHAESTPDWSGPKLGVQTDIYALAMTIWELFSGQPPFAHLRKDAYVMVNVLNGARPSKPSATTEIGFTDDVWDLIQRGWAKEPSDRPMLSEFLEFIRESMAVEQVQLCAYHALPLAVLGRTTLVPAVELSSPPAISRNDDLLTRHPMPFVRGPSPAAFAHAPAETSGYAHTRTRQPGPYQYSISGPYVHGQGHGYGIPARPGTLVAAASTPGAYAPWPAPPAPSYEAAAMAEDEQSYSHGRANTDPYTHGHDFPVRPAALVAAASTPSAHAYALAPGAPAAPVRRSHTHAPQPAHSAFSHGFPAAATATEQMHPSPPRTHASTSGAAGATTLADTFKFPTSTGRRRALCIGINYAGAAHALRGCVNDARNVRKFLLEHQNFSDGDIVLLTDDVADPRVRPTRWNVLNAMRWLVRDARPDDNSGHGGRTKDLDGDERDGLDEIILPCDYKNAGHILDRDMHAIIVRPLPVGCRLTALFDSCHSGSPLDLPYLYGTDGRFKGLHVLPRAHRLRLPELSADVICFAGSDPFADYKDSGTSADTLEGGLVVGAISDAFVRSLKEQPEQSYVGLHESTRWILKGGYKQKPQLSSSHRIDTTSRFII